MTTYSYAPEAQNFKDESIPITSRVLAYSKLINAQLDTYDAVKLGAPYAKFPLGMAVFAKMAALKWAQETFGSDHVMTDILGTTYVLFSTWEQAMMFKLQYSA